MKIENQKCLVESDCKITEKDLGSEKLSNGIYYKVKTNDKIYLESNKSQDSLTQKAKYFYGKKIPTVVNNSINAENQQTSQINK